VDRVTWAIRILKWVIGVALVLLAVGVVLWFVAKAAFSPRVEGELAAKGLREPATILRDVDGVAHIRATSVRDAVFALGHLHAQERLWQLETHRRIASGRLSEILGAGALSTDKFIRTLGVPQVAAERAKSLDDRTRELLQAYADGINAVIASGKTTPEHLILRAGSIEPWRIEDSLGWQIMMAWDLSTNWTNEVLRLRLSGLTDKAGIDSLLLNDPVPAATRDYVALYRELGVAPGVSPVPKVEAPQPAQPGWMQRQLLAQLAPMLDLEGRAQTAAEKNVGSNNWVVAGSRSATGKPLLANDPHLSFSAPSLWYLAHLQAPGLDVIGASMPGLPAIVLGRNQAVAWGFTNTGPDTQDLYIEEIDAANPAQYRMPDGFAPFTTRTETIKVKGEADVQLTVRITRHGPVISEVSSTLNKALAAQNRYVVSLRWAALEPDDQTMRASFDMNLAGNFDAFVEALRNFHAPQQNVVFASTDGRIGFVAPGRIPLRAIDNDLMGLAPAPGWEARYDWNGFLPFENLPRNLNPSTGALFSANAKVVTPDYPFFITAEWASAYRTDRIGDLLRATDKHTPESFGAMHMDNLSGGMKAYQPFWRKMFNSGKASPGRVTDVLTRLAVWNGRMDAGSEAAIIAAWWREMLRLTFEDDLAGVWPDAFNSQLNRALLAATQGNPDQARWCDDTRTPARESCEEIGLKALDSALVLLERVSGTAEMSRWNWAQLHSVRMEHRPFSRVGLLQGQFELRFPVASDPFSVNQSGFRLRDPDLSSGARPTDQFATVHGAGYRAIYDMANADGGSFISSTGQNGLFMLPGYSDYGPKWAAGERVPMRMSDGALSASTRHALRLVPSP
jgi:penicillin amidase